MDAAAAKRGRGALGRLRTKHALLPKRQRLAVDLTLGAATLGLAFALADPHLSVVRRLGRIAVDAIIVLGIAIYIDHPEPIRPAPRTRLGRAVAWSERAALGLVGIGAIAFTLTAPHIDPYLRLYRTTLGIVLLVAMTFDVRRPVPKGFFGRIIGAQILFGIVEAIMLIYATWTVDEPIAYAAGKATIARTTHQLLTTGMIAPAPRIADAFPYGGFATYRNGRIYGTDGLYDVMRWTNDDPLGMVLAMADAVVKRPVGEILASPSLTDAEQCAAYARIGSPRNGYRLASDGVFIERIARRCDDIAAGRTP